MSRQRLDGNDDQNFVLCGVKALRVLALAVSMEQVLVGRRLAVVRMA